MRIPKVRQSAFPLGVRYSKSGAGVVVTGLSGRTCRLYWVLIWALAWVLVNAKALGRQEATTKTKTKRKANKSRHKPTEELEALI